MIKPDAWVHTPGASKCNSTLAVQIIKESALPGPPLITGYDTADGVVAWGNAHLTADMQISLLLEDAKLVHNIRIDHFLSPTSPMGSFDHYTVTDGNGALLTGSSHCIVVYQAASAVLHTVRRGS